MSANNMEVWDLYNENRELTGRTHVRGEKIPEGCYHPVVHVWIRNSKGEYLISQRSADRPSFPLMWETTGGSVLAGESSLQGAIREAKEEVGIDLAAENGRLCFSQVRKIIDGKPFQDILDVWLFQYDGPLSPEFATTDEVAQCRWMTPDEIAMLFRSEQFVSTLQYFFTEINKEHPL